MTFLRTSNKVTSLTRSSAWSSRRSGGHPHPQTGGRHFVDENSPIDSWVRLTLTCARACTIALSCTRSIACSPSPSPSQPDRLTPPSHLYPHSSHAGSFCGRQKSRFIDVDEATCYDRCGHAGCSHKRCDYDRWSLRGTSSQTPCPGLGPAEERACTLALYPLVASTH